MLTTIRYEYQTGVCTWPLPFAPEDPAQLDVRVVAATGLERRLNPGEYALLDSTVACVLQPGESLLIHMDIPQAGGIRAAAAQPQMASAQVVQATAYDPAPVAEKTDSAQEEKLASLEAQLASLKEEQNQALLQARAVEEDRQVQTVAARGEAALAAIDEQTQTAVLAVELAHADAEDAIAEASQRAEAATASAANAASRAELAGLYAENKTANAIATLEKRVAELEEQLAARMASQEKVLREAAATGQNQIAAAMRAATRDAQARSRLAGEAWPQVGHWLCELDQKAGSVLQLPEPLRYYPGRHALAVFLNGAALAPGVDFAEVGQTLSQNWRTLREILAGDLLLFVIAPTNAGQAAALAAKEAGQAAASAQNHAASAGRYVSDCAAQVACAARHKNEASQYAKDAESWLRLSEEQTRQAHCLRDQAAHEAWQASIVATRPGIAAVSDEAQLARVVEGVYFVNPHLLQTPTRFYGIWPVADLDAPILWDGVFFQGPAYEREPYVLPYPTPCPCLPPRPAPPVEVVEGKDWQPCNHIHHLPCGCAQTS